MRKTKPSPARLEEIKRRQDPPQWGTGYVPGQLATREEAPDYSRASKIQSYWLGRTAHAVSEPELYSYVLASWLGVFFELHEGRMMHPEPAPGFLANCPGLSQQYVGRHQGTINAAQRLGLLHFHPTLRTRKGVIAYPMLADQLYFARDEEGVYAVNWCIKNEPEDFEKAFSVRGPTEKKKSDEEHQARLLIEAEVFRDAGIRTIHVALRDIPEHLRHNLRALYPFQFRSDSLCNNLREDFISTVGERLPKQVPVIETIATMMRRNGGTQYDYQVAFYQAVWRKEIRCDLLRPLTIDMPLRSADKDLVRHFVHWYTRRPA